MTNGQVKKREFDSAETIRFHHLDGNHAAVFYLRNGAPGTASASWLVNPAPASDGTKPIGELETPTASLLDNIECTDSIAPPTCNSTKR